MTPEKDERLKFIASVIARAFEQTPKQAADDRAIVAFEKACAVMDPPPNLGEAIRAMMWMIWYVSDNMTRVGPSAGRDLGDVSVLDVLGGLLLARQQMVPPSALKKSQPS